MKINIQNSENKFSIFRNKYSNSKKIIFLFILIFLTVYSSVLFYLGSYARENGFVYDVIKQSVRENYKIPFNLVKSFFSAPDKIFLDIKHIDYQMLSYNRDKALAKGIIETTSSSFVNCEIKHHNKSVKGKIRLKGDLMDHIKGKKWSFRIKLKDNNTIFGMKTFSLQHPKMRHYLYEWVYHKALKENDIISLRYKFVELVINGKNMGIYAIEEHFNKELIESNKFREGPIISYNEDLLMLEQSNLENTYGSFLSSSIETFETKKLMKNVDSKIMAGKAIKLLDAFRKGEISTSEVFNITKLARYFALSDLFGAEHATRWFNIRFYYNPVISKLEPIGNDGSPKDTKITYLIGNKKHMFINQNLDLYNYNSTYFSDPNFFGAYISELENISQTDFLDNFFDKIESELNYNKNILYKNYPYFNFDKDLFYKNQEFIKRTINPIQALRVYYDKFESNNIHLSVSNLQSLPIEIHEMIINDHNFKPVNNKYVNPKNNQKPTDFNSFLFSNNEKDVFNPDDIKNAILIYSIIGSSNTMKTNVISEFPMDNNIQHDYIEYNYPNLESFNYLKIIEEEKKIIFPSDSITIKENMIIPKGYHIFGVPGLKINLLNYAKIISYSPIFLLGDEENKILVTSSDSTGQGITVINANEISIINHVKFYGLSSKKTKWIESPGAINFYESPLEINNCEFLNNIDGDDYVNIVRSKFKISNTIFSNVAHDAVDIDFGEGEISYTKFFNIGNDGIDVSGSQVTLDFIEFENCFDKCISVGEESTLKLTNGIIKKARIGIASKDNSSVVANRLLIEECMVGIALYQKKSEYGPSVVVANDTKLLKNNHDYFVEFGSVLNFESEHISSNKKNIYNILQSLYPL
jgi:hypothetical protein